MSNEPKVSVVMVNYNGLSNLGSILDKSIKTCFEEACYSNFNVIFIDNASNDGSASYIRRKYGKEGKLRVVRLRKNVGFARACNIGALFAKTTGAKYIVFCNVDVIFGRAWLANLVSLLERNPWIGAASPVILYPNGKIQELGGVISYIGFPYALFDGCNYDVLEQLTKRIDKEYILVPYATGSCFITRCELFFKLGGFEKRYFMYLEDSDYCYRLWRRGYASAVALRCHVVHYRGSCGGSLVNRYFTTRNGIWFVARHYGLLRSIIAALVRLHLVLRSADPQQRILILKAVYKGIKGVPRLKKPIYYDACKELKPAAKILNMFSNMIRDQVLLLPKRRIAEDFLLNYSCFKYIKKN